jgi:hypothetical protein
MMDYETNYSVPQDHHLDCGSGEEPNIYHQYSGEDITNPSSKSMTNKL